MIFLNSWVFFALPALVLPVLIYFLINRKRIELKFAAFEWMQRAVEKRRKLNRVDDLLKLLAKILLILAIVIFMGRLAFSSQHSKHVLVVLDNSMSMGAVSLGKTGLDHARELIQQLPKEFESASFTFASYDGEIQILAERMSPDEAKIILSDVEPGPGPGGTPDSLADAIQTLPDLKRYDTICVISDFQASDYQNSLQIRNALKRLPQRKVFIPLDRKETLKNLSIASFEIPQEGFYPGRNNTLTAVVVNDSDDTAASIPVTLSVDGIKRDMTLLTIPPHASAEAYLTLNLPADSDSLIEVSLPPDAMKSDNTILVSAHPRSKLNILGIMAQPSADSFPPDVFLKNAIESFSENGDFFRYQSVSPEETAGLEMSNYDVVICYGIPLDANSSLTRDLLAYLKTGRSVISFADAAGTSGTPWKGLGVEATLTCQEGQLIPDRGRLENTYLSFMQDSRFEVEKFLFRKAGGLDWTNPPEQTRSCLFLKGIEAPVMLSAPYSGGRLILAGFQPDLKFGTLFHNPNWVQFTRRLIADALPKESFLGVCGRDARRIPLPEAIASDVKTGDLLTVEPDAPTKEQTELAKKEHHPLPRRIDGKVELQNGAKILILPDGVLQNHTYTVKRNDQSLFRIALNSTRKDSNLTPADPVVFQDAASDGLVFRTANDVIQGTFRSEYYLLALFLLLAAVAFDCYAHFLRKR